MNQAKHLYRRLTFGSQNTNHVYHGKENSTIYVQVCQTQINELASGKKHNTTNLNKLLLCITFYHMR